MKQITLYIANASLPRQIVPLLTGLSLLAIAGVASPQPTVAQEQIAQNAAPPPSGANSSNATGTYTLGGGDNIRVDIFDLPQLSGNYQIPAGGVIQLPLIGSISIQGLTLEEATTAISNAYAPVLKRPQITVSLQATRPLNVWISGEVNRPGSYSIPLSSGAGNVPSVQFPTLVQAIERAQGVTQIADIRRVEVRRRAGGVGQAQVITFDLWQYLQTGTVSADITLRDGDAIFIPTAPAVNLAEARQIAISTFAPPPSQARTVAVVGEVTRPGRYVVVGGDTLSAQSVQGLPTVTRAIQLAGGLKPQADIRQVQVRRPTSAGSEQIFSVNLWQLLESGDVNQDTILQDGDTIIIPTAAEINPAEISAIADASFSPAKIQINVVGEIVRPGLVEVPTNTSLNQALMAAGGFNSSRAKKSSVELLRLNFDGTVSRRIIQLDFTQGINEQTNPLVRNQDIIVVRRSATAGVVDTVNLILNPTAALLAVPSTGNALLSLLNSLGLIRLPK
ncbi:MULTISPECIES: SLBB domain-containing protein [Kamptonema]|uniref:SLBB domain-containing protein n=1 Tax=Kamptonema TaxID=1501433 RepID=UPI0001DAD2F4|nr:MULTISPECIES: SLBB domain-containing protein [Kamptonema]CBN54668.1 Polysaccharide biosynthesis/export protein [Kamptonema sp. PCC 6506]